MWGVGLTICILGIIAMCGEKRFRNECLYVVFIVIGLVAMWVGQ